MYRFAGVLCALLLTAAPAGAAEGYHEFAALESELAAWAGEHAALELLEIGRSSGGRKLWVARLGSGADVDARPAVFVGANIAGYHNAGSEAALHLIETLLGGEHKELLAQRTFYVAPALNPDAHDGMFAVPRMRRSGADGRLDRDVDGLAGEDGPDDLDGNGVITQMRVRDPRGDRRPDPDDPRTMAEAKGLDGEEGGWIVMTEGDDDDGDGEFNEDGPGGLVPDKNFAHAYKYDDPEAGPWPSRSPEARAIMDFLLGRRNVVLAVVYGPANNLLAPPRSLGGGGDTGSLKLKIPSFAAEMLGFDPEGEYTIDEIWEVAQSLPFVVQNGITKEQLQQFLGAGPATKPDDDDLALLDKIADGYKKALEEAGLDTKREGKQYGGGGFTPWLYYQYGVTAFEVDVWGVPKPKKEESGDADKLTLDALEEMSSEDFVALGPEKVDAFLREIGAPPQFTGEALIARVESGQITPKQMVTMARQMGAGAGGGGKDDKKKGGDDLLVFLDEHAPGAIHPWTKVTLADGREAEAGGPGPFAAIAPPRGMLDPAIAVHTQTVIDLAGRFPEVEIVETGVEPLGGGVYRVRAVARNTGFLPTHSKLGVRAQSHLPLRMELELGDGVTRITGPPWATADRLAGHTGTMEAQWLLHGPPKGGTVVVTLHSENAGTDRREVRLEGGAR